MTRSGSTSRRCASCGTWRCGSTNCRSRCSSRGGRARPRTSSWPRSLAEPSCPRIELAPLTGRGVAAIVRAARSPRPSRGFCDACAELTGGNPLYVVELVGAITGGGDGRARRRGARASPNCVRGRCRPASSLASRVAVGTRWSWPRAVAIAGEGTSAGPGERAGRAGSRRGRGCRGRARRGGRAALRRAAGVRASTRARGRLRRYPGRLPRRRHAEAARLLHGEGADPELVSSQLLRASASGEGWAVEQLRTAARRALDRGVPEAASRYLSRALEEPSPRSLRAELLAECAFAARLTGAPDALELLEQAIELTADPVERARLLKTMGQALLDLGRMVDAAEAFERGLAELAATDAQAPELRATLRAGVEICGRYGSPERGLGRRARPLARRSASRATPVSGRCWPSWRSSAAWRSRRRATRYARSRSARSATGRRSWTGTARGRPCSWSSRWGCARSTSP